MLGGYITIVREHVHVCRLCNKEYELKEKSELGESAERFPTRVANQTKQKGKQPAIAD